MLLWGQHCVQFYLSNEQLAGVQQGTDGEHEFVVHDFFPN